MTLCGFVLWEVLCWVFVFGFPGSLCSFSGMFRTLPSLKELNWATRMRLVSVACLPVAPHGTRGYLVASARKKPWGSYCLRYHLNSSRLHYTLFFDVVRRSEVPHPNFFWVSACKMDCLQSFLYSECRVFWFLCAICFAAMVGFRRCFNFGPMNWSDPVWLFSISRFVDWKADLPMSDRSSKGPNIFSHLFASNVFFECFVLVAHFLIFSQFIEALVASYFLILQSIFVWQAWIYRTKNERINELIWKNNVFWTSTSTSEETIKNYNYTMFFLKCPTTLAPKKKVLGQTDMFVFWGFWRQKGCPWTTSFVGELNPAPHICFSKVPPTEPYICLAKHFCLVFDFVIALLFSICFLGNQTPFYPGSTQDSCIFFKVGIQWLPSN